MERVSLDMHAIEALQQLRKEELLDRWRKLPGKQLPPTRSDRLLRELAYRLQEQQFGRLDKNTAVSLSRHMTEFQKSLNSKQANAPELKTPAKVVLESGSIIGREWDGKHITVQVVGARQFVWEGKNFKSLSAVARKITGQHLSGPMFFGLKEERHG